MKNFIYFLFFVSFSATASFYACSNKNPEWEGSCAGWAKAQNDNMSDGKGAVYYVPKDSTKTLWLHDPNLCLDITSSTGFLGLGVPVMIYSELKEFIEKAEGKTVVTNCSSADSLMVACGDPRPKPNCVQAKVFVLPQSHPDFDPNIYTCDGASMNYTYEEVIYGVRSANDTVYCMNKSTATKQGSVPCLDCKYADTWGPDSDDSTSNGGLNSGDGNGSSSGSSGSSSGSTNGGTSTGDPPPRSHVPGRMGGGSIGSNSR